MRVLVKKNQKKSLKKIKKIRVRNNNNKCCGFFVLKRIKSTFNS